MQSFKLNSAQCLIVLILLVTWTNLNCSKEEKSPKVDSDGLTKEIRDIVPDSILTIMRNMGMPINGGANPPLLNADQSQQTTYFIDDQTTVNTSVPFDNVDFSDMTITFKEQNADNLTIKYDFVSHSNFQEEKGTGIGSFIVGDGCKFSIFSQFTSNINGASAKGVSIISGAISPNGIVDYHHASVMVDDFGDPQNVFINKGQGRVIKEADGFAERIGASSEWGNGSDALNYDVPNGVFLIPQPNNVTCWAASITMMIMWRDNTSYTISTAMNSVGSLWKSKFEEPNGLTDDEWSNLTFILGLKSEQMSPSVEKIADLLKNGPLLVAIDEDPSSGFSAHAKIITGIHGDGSPECTYLNIVDPWPPTQGKRYDESYQVFMGKVSQVLGSSNFIPIQHW